MASVLVIDDNEIMRRALSAYLEVHGHQVRVAEDAEQGIREFEHERPDVVLIDWVLAESTTGLDVLTQVRECAPRQPIIMMSGHSAQEIEPQLQAIPQTYFFSKTGRPDDLESLLELISQAAAS